MVKLMADAFFDMSKDLCAGRHSEYWLKGGRGSTKSSWISLEIIAGMLEDDHADAIVYRRVGNTVKDSVYAQMIWAIDQLGLSRYFVYRKSPFEIICPTTGQRILFRGADDPMKSKSIKLLNGHYFKYLWFEELSEFRNMEDIRTIKQSVFRGVDRGVTFYSYNPPKTVQAWVNGEALRDAPERYVHNSTYLDVPREWLGEQFIETARALEQSNPTAYKNEYLGEVTGTGGQVFENLKLREITDDEMSSFGYTYAGLDWGWFPDPTHFVRCAFDTVRRRLWIYDEYRTVKTDNRDIYAYLTQEKGLTRNEEVIADSAEQKSIHDMRYYGMNCTGATKGAGSVRTSIRWLQALSEIIIDPKRAPYAAREFQEYEYVKNRDGELVDAYPDANNHAIDAVRYALNRVWLRSGQ